MITQTNKINYKKDTILNSTSHILYLFILWLMTIITPRIGSSSDAGLFTIALSVSNICTAIATYSINYFIASDIKRKYTDQHYLYFGLTSTTISLIVSVIISLAFGYYKDPTMFWAVILFYIFKCAENFTLIIQANMQRLGKLYISGIALIIKSIICLLIFSLTLFLSKNIVLSFGLISIFAFIYLIFVDFQLLRKYKTEKYKFDLNIYKSSLYLFILALPLFIYGLSFSTIVSFPRMILEKYVSKSVVGYFGTMAAITTIIQSGVSSLFLPFVPKLTELNENKDKKGILKILGIFTLLTILISSIAFICSLFLDKWLMGILYPTDSVALEYAHYFKWIIIVACIQALVLIYVMTIISLKKILFLGISSFISLITTLLCSLLIIKTKLINGVLITYLVGYGGFLFLLLIIIFVENIRAIRINI